MATASEALSAIHEETLTKQPLTPTQLAWRRFRRHKMAMFGLLLLILLIVYVVGGSFVFAEKYANFVNTGIKLQGPSSAHPWGTDAVGRDILARSIYGGQISLLIGLSAVIVALVAGVTVGAVSGYYGGWIDSILMRFTEAMLCIPQLFLLIVAAKYLGDKIHNFQAFGREFSGSVIVSAMVTPLLSNSQPRGVTLEVMR